MGFNFAPRGWASCDGQVLPINQNQSLYSLLGTTYGGDGRTSFALPDLRSRTPVHPGLPPQGYEAIRYGQKSGTETHTLTIEEMPVHSHQMLGTTNAATSDSPSNQMYATTNRTPYLAPGSGTQTTLSSNSIANAGASVPHENMQPFRALNFCIAMQGLFPSRS